MNWHKRPFVVRCKQSSVQLKVAGNRFMLTPRSTKDLSDYKAYDLMKNSNIATLLQHRLIQIEHPEPPLVVPVRVAPALVPTAPAPVLPAPKVVESKDLPREKKEKKGKPVK